VLIATAFTAEVQREAAGHGLRIPAGAIRVYLDRLRESPNSDPFEANGALFVYPLAGCSRSGAPSWALSSIAVRGGIDLVACLARARAQIKTSPLRDGLSREE
jgi:hypothetical protein